MDGGRFNKIILICIYLTIFVSSWVLFKYPFEFYFGYFIFIPLLPAFFFKFGIPKWTILFLLLLLFGIFNIFIGNNTIALFIKIFFGLFFSFLFYYYVIVNYDFQIEKLFKYYLKGAYIISIIGLVQFVSYQINFKPGFDYGWLLNKWGFVPGGNFGIRINSIFPEPTHFATFISCAFLISAYDLFNKSPFYYNKIQSVIVILTYLLTFSGVAYAGVLITLILFLLNYGLIRYLLLAIPVFLAIFYLVYNNVLEFRLRTDSTIEIFSTSQFSIGKTHGSSIILYNNYHIAVENFKKHFLFGTGLGSHPIAAEKYSITKNIEVAGFTSNYADANSMFLRIMSEMGLFGIILVFWILFKGYLRKPTYNNISSNHWLISNALFVLILLNLFRQGHYFLNGFPFYIWLYLYNFADYLKMKTESEKILK